MSFVSYEFQKDLGYDPTIKQNRWQYKIIDSDFEEVVVVVGVEVEVAVIEAYEKRNLPVAKNLLLSILYCSKQWGYSVSVERIIQWNKQYNPKFALYKDDLNKYLSLL